MREAMGGSGDAELQVLDCADFKAASGVTASDFFEGCVGFLCKGVGAEGSWRRRDIRHRAHARPAY
jgi:hypothetical protein